MDNNDIFIGTPTETNLRELGISFSGDILIVDARGQVLANLLAGKDPEAYMDELGEEANSAEYGVRNFVNNLLLPAIDEYGARNIIFVWEGGNERRRAIYPEYKQKRKDPSKAAGEQIDKAMKMIKSLLAALGIVQVAAPTCEADDMVALLCESLPCDLDVITNDADLAQLDKEYEDKTVTVIVGGNVIDKEYKGIPTNLIPLYKSLVGDSSDGYIGVKGFGPAAWNSLVEAYGFDGLEEMDEILMRGDFSEFDDVELCPALKKALDRKNEWKTSYTLAKLHPEWVGTPFQGRLCPPTWYVRVPNRAKVQGILKACDLEHVYEDIEDILPNFILLDSEAYDEETKAEVKAEIAASEFVALDFETYDPEDPDGTVKKVTVDPLSHEPTGASLAFGKNFENIVYMTFEHKDSKNLDRSTLTELLEFINEKGIPVVAHSSQFELEICERCFGVSPEIHYDTQHLSMFVDENNDPGLKGLSEKLLGYKQKTFKETLGDKHNMAELTAEEAAFPYGCDDALVTVYLYILFRLQATVEGTLDFYEKYIPPSQEIAVLSRRQGVYVSTKVLDEYAKDDEKLIEDSLGKILPLLRKHCSDPPEAEVVKNFLGQDFMQVMQAKGLNREELQAKFEAEFEKIMDYCEYKDYEKIVSEPVWTPTKGKFKSVCQKLGLPLLEKFSPSHVSEYIREVISTHSDLTEEQDKFLELLGEAAPFLRERSGREYDRLKEFCIKVCGLEGKVIEVGTKVDTGSTKKMQWLLYCMLGLPVRVRSDVAYGSFRAKAGLQGAPSTNDKAIASALAFDVGEDDWRREVLNALLDIKSAETRRSLYFKPYPELISKRDGRMHQNIRLLGTVTRRPTCSDPNILQVSSGKDGYRLRKAFSGAYTEKVTGFDDTYLVVSIDFSQQELRILASEANDPDLIACYVGKPEERRDVHTKSAVAILKRLMNKDLSYEEAARLLEDADDELGVTLKEIRKDKAKPVNFAIAYGGVAATVALNLAITLDEAEELIDAVLDTYKRIIPWQQEVAMKARRDGKVPTAYGNFRHAPPAIFSGDSAVQRRAYRQLANSTIQGCAADILAIVMSEMRRRDILGRTHSVLMAPVYDEIVSLVPHSMVWEYISEMIEIMEITPPGHPVGMEADVSLGHTWGDQVELGIHPKKEDVLAAADKAKEDMKAYLKYIEEGEAV